VLLWPRVSTTAVRFAPWIGLALGLTAWLVTTSTRSGAISVLTTGDPINAVAGNIASSAGGALAALVLTLLFPNDFDPTDPDHVARSHKINGIRLSPPRAKEPNSTTTTTTISGTCKHHQPHSTPLPDPKTTIPTGNEVVDFLEAKQIEPMDPLLVKRGERLAAVGIASFFVVAVAVVPFTLFGTHYVFSKPAFTGWVVVSFLWVWVSMLVCVVWPVVESAGALRDIGKGVWADLMGRGRGRKGVGGGRGYVEGGRRRDWLGRVSGGGQLGVYVAFMMMVMMMMILF